MPWLAVVGLAVVAIWGIWEGTRRPKRDADPLEEWYRRVERGES